MNAILTRDRPLERAPLEERAVDWLRSLIAIPTVNPPGCEEAAAAMISGILEGEGHQVHHIEPRPGRVSVVARLPGNGRLRPLLLTGHLDVVGAEAVEWTHPPFEGRLSGGFLWGRGAIDCKGIVIQNLVTFLKLAREGVVFDRDLVFAAVADEEAGSRWGAHHLVEEHRHLVEAEYAIGELGAISQEILGRTVFSIQVAERGTAKLMVEIGGVSRHGALPGVDPMIEDLLHVLKVLTTYRSGFKLTPVTSRSLETLGRKIGGVRGACIRSLAHPAIGRVLTAVLPRGRARSLLDAVTRDTLRITGIETPGAGSGNTTARLVRIHLDGRCLPGRDPGELAREVQDLVGRRHRVTLVTGSWPVEGSPDDPLYRVLESTLEEARPGALVIPGLMPGGTDAKAWVRMGCRYYGFSPIDLGAHPGMRLADMIHGPDERIPIEGFRWGLEVHHRAIRRFMTES